MAVAKKLRLMGASARQMVCGMRARNFMAPKMAQGLGQREVLLGQMSGHGVNVS
jgi:hypothetical protein